MYYIFYPLFYLISLLPWRVFYMISDFFAFILQRVIKYRVDVVAKNLAIAFPEKNEAERKKIHRFFFRNN